MSGITYLDIENRIGNRQIQWRHNALKTFLALSCFCSILLFYVGKRADGPVDDGLFSSAMGICYSIGAIMHQPLKTLFTSFLTKPISRKGNTTQIPLHILQVLGRNERDLASRIWGWALLQVQWRKCEGGIKSWSSGFQTGCHGVAISGANEFDSGRVNVEKLKFL